MTTDSLVLEAKPSGWGKAAFSRLARHRLGTYFEHLFLHGQLPSGLEERPVVFFCNHSAWMDTELSHYLVSQQLNLEYYLMAHSDSVKRWPFMRRYGCFGVDSSNPFGVTATMQYAANLLRNQPGRAVVMFPQGQFTRCTQRPLIFQAGTAQLIRLVKDVVAVPLALHYDLFFNKRPEAYIRFGTPLSFNNDAPPTRQLNAQLEQALTSELDTLQNAINTFQYDQFRIMMKGKQSLPASILDRLRTSEVHVETLPKKRARLKAS